VISTAAGAEPLEVDQGRFLALFRGRNTPIKSALLNQKLLRGVGNIYADESRSVRHPSTAPRFTIPRAQLERSPSGGAGGPERGHRSGWVLESPTTSTPMVKKASSS